MAFKLTAVLDNLDELPESIDPRELYTESKDGKFELTGEGIKTIADINRLQVSLTKERADHKDTKLKIKGYGDWTPEQIAELEERAETAEANVGTGKGGRPTDEQVQKLVDVKIAKIQKDFDKQLKELQVQNQSLLGENGSLLTDKRSRTLRDEISAVRAGDKGIKLVAEAVEDAELFLSRVMTFDDDGKPVTKEGVGVEPGQSVREVITQIQVEGKRPHWFEGTVGAGAGGGKGGSRGQRESGPNVFDKATFDFGAASKIMREDPIRGKRLIETAKDPSQARTVFASKLK